MEVLILPAAAEDAAALVEVQNRAFRADFERYGVCPGYGNPVMDMAAFLDDPANRCYKILVDGRVAGDILVTGRDEGVYFLECICVAPQLQGKGVGRAAMSFLDREFPDAAHWMLVTPADKAETLRFYERHGYVRTGSACRQGVELALLSRRLGLEPEVDRHLAESMTWDGADILPYLPYLLQDLWELGSSPDEMIRLLEGHLPCGPGTRILDLGCGKGAVAVQTAAALGVSVTGIDLMPESIEVARAKAVEHRVDHLCRFRVGDITRAVEVESGYDCVIYGAVGPVLGDHTAIFAALRKVIRPRGYILLDDAYRRDDSATVRSLNQCPTLPQLEEMADRAGLDILARAPGEAPENGDEEYALIARRAEELTALYPRRQDLFRRYLQSQRDEYDDLGDGLVGLSWLLRRRD